ncbi:hypothetical protein NEAUS03_0206 [Nematocida ausubeli]|nr:hypothetical protein NEAUS03_0206 [Nematocida ausubeli]
MDLININGNNMMAGQPDNLSMKVTIEFPQELTEKQRDLKNDLLTIFASAADLQRKVSDATEKMLMNTEVWKELITLNFSEEARKRKVAHFLATNWIKEQNDDLIHIVGMLKSKNCQLTEKELNPKRTEERLDLFLKEVGRSIAHWIEVEFAIDLIVDRDYKDAQHTGEPLRMTEKERSYTKALHRAYRTIINDSNMIKDKNANMHHYMKSIVEEYYRQICNSIRLEDKDVKVVPVDKIFMHNPNAVNIEDILRSIESKFAKEMEKTQQDARALLIALLSDLKTILQNWDDIVKAEETVRKLFYSEKLENLVYNFNGRDENTLKDFNKKLDKYIGQHIKRKDSDVLKAHAKIHGKQSKTEYLLKIYHNLIKLIKNNGDVIKKAKQIEFSKSIIQCLDGGELHTIYSYEAESHVLPFSKEQKSVVNNYGIESKRKLFSSLDRIISLFWSRRTYDVVYDSAALQENTEEPHLTNSSLLTSAVNISNHTEASNMLNEFKRVLPQNFSEKVNSVGLFLSGQTSENAEDSPMQEQITEEDLHSMITVESILSTEDSSERTNFLPSRKQYRDLSNEINSLIDTETAEISQKRIYTVMFYVVNCLLLGISIYSNTLGCRLIAHTFGSVENISFIYLLCVVLACVFGGHVALDILYLLASIIRDLRAKKHKINSILTGGLLFCAGIAIVYGIVFPFLFNIDKIDSYFSWLGFSLLATVTFMIYSMCSKEEILKEMHGIRERSAVNRKIPDVILYAVVMVLAITLTHAVQIVLLNDLPSLFDGLWHE